MYKKLYLLMAILVIASMVLTACGGTATTEAPVTEEAPVATEEAPVARKKPLATEEAPVATKKPRCHRRSSGCSSEIPQDHHWTRLKTLGICFPGQ